MPPFAGKSGFYSASMRLCFACFLLAACTAFAYWDVDKCSFSRYDDPTYVYKNRHVAAGFTKANIAWAFTSFDASNWHPVTWLSHMLDYQIYGLRPAGHHLTSLLFHILNTLLLFFALRSLTGTFWRSAFVAALFALHPLHVESVAWVSERKDVLCAFFMFISLLCYSSYVQRRRHWDFYCFALFFFVLGLMAKPMIVTLPFVLLLCDFWPLGRFGTTADPAIAQNAGQRAHRFLPVLAEKIPFFFLSLTSCIITVLSQRAGNAIVKATELSLPLRFENSALSYVKYVQKMFWPGGLSFFYPVSVYPHFVWKVCLALALILLISLCAVVRRKKQPYLLVGWLWFLGTLVPVIGLVQVGSQALADRYTYIPLVGLFIIVAWLVCDLAGGSTWPRVLAVSGSCVALVLLALQTRVQAGYWQNDLALSEHALAVNRNNFLAYSMKGNFLLARGDYDSALACFAQSIALCPSQIPPRMNTGSILLGRGKAREAIGVFTQLLALDSAYAPAYLDCGKAYAILGKRDSAIACFCRAIAIDPGYSPALYNLGAVFEAMGNYRESMGYLVRACRADTADAEAFLELEKVRRMAAMKKAPAF
jgi:protein O-mannosyl-transferase